MNAVLSAFQDNLQSWALALPELWLSLFFLLAILANAFGATKPTITLSWIGIGGALALTLGQLHCSPVQLFDQLLALSPGIVLYKTLALGASLFVLLITKYNHSIQQSAKGKGEFYILLAGLNVGMSILCMSQHWLAIFLALEMVSLGSYLLTAYAQNTTRASESAAKYLLFGAIASALMLYGISLLYGYTQTLHPFDPRFLAELSKAPGSGVAIALLLVLAGFLFKVSAVPFHFWTPDVYESVPIPIAAFFSSAPKIAGFAVLARFSGIFAYPMDNYSLIWPNFPWQALLAALATASILLGNLSALNQQNIQRLLGYSSIAHTGFLLLAILPFSAEGQTTLVFYLIVYSLATLLAFFSLQDLQQRYGVVQLTDLKGLGKTERWQSSMLTWAGISLIGIPATAGFIGKFLVFSVGFQAWSVNGNAWILIALISGVVGTILSVFYYFQLPLQLFLRSGNEQIKTTNFTVPILIALIISLLILAIGLYPGLLQQALQACFENKPERFYFSP